MTFIPAFSERQSLPLPRPPLDNERARRAAGLAPRGNPTISSHPGKISLCPRFRNPSVHRQLLQPGDENGDLPGRNYPARFGNHNHAGRSLIGWGSRKKSARPGDDRVLSQDQKNLHTSTTPTIWGRKRLFSRVETAPHGVETPVPLADRRLVGDRI